MKKLLQLVFVFSIVACPAANAPSLAQNPLLPICAEVDPLREFNCSFERWRGDIDANDWGEQSNVSQSRDFQDNPLFPQDSMALRIDVTDDSDPNTLFVQGRVFMAAQGVGIGGVTRQAPRALRGFYKFSPQGDGMFSATARVVVVLPGGVFDEKGTGVFSTTTPTSSEFTLFDVPIEYTAAFDTMAFHRIEWDIYVAGASASAIGTYAILDNVSMVSFSPVGTAYLWWLIASGRARGWSPDAVLAALRSGDAGIQPNGESPDWIYEYYSTSFGKQGSAGAFSVTVRDGEVVDAAQVDPAALPSTDPLPEGWMDSDAAAAIAEMNSGDYWTNNPDATVSARIALELASDPSIPVWEFVYRSSGDSLVVLVDAINGDVVGTAIEDLGPGQPSSVSLDAYPLPFSESVTIDFDAPGSAGRIEIFDVLGRRIRTIPLDVRGIGPHSVVWDGLTEAGSPSANGIYAIRLVTSEIARARVVVRSR